MKWPLKVPLCPKQLRTANNLRTLSLFLWLWERCGISEGKNRKLWRMSSPKFNSSKIRLFEWRVSKPQRRKFALVYSVKDKGYEGLEVKVFRWRMNEWYSQKATDHHNSSPIFHMNWRHMCCRGRESRFLASLNWKRVNCIREAEWSEKRRIICEMTPLPIRRISQTQHCNCPFTRWMNGDLQTQFNAFFFQV